MAATTADLVQRFVELSMEKRAGEESVEKVKEQLAVLEQELLTRFSNAGMQSVKTASGHTVYLRRQIWASPANKDMGALVAALRNASGADPALGAMVKEKVDVQTLSAYMREREEELKPASLDALIEGLPGDLAKAVSVYEKFDLRCKSS